MVQPGRGSTVKGAKDRIPASSPKWGVRLPSARRKVKWIATPHPGKVGGYKKREALMSMPETGRARKKIVFELEEPAAGANEEASTPAGIGMESSPTGERKGSRRTMEARPGPFEALYFATSEIDVESGVLPLRARELRFSMGKMEALARIRDGEARRADVDGLPEVDAGTGLAGAWSEDDRPVVERAGGEEENRSTHLEVVTRFGTMDEDALAFGDGANMLSKSTILVAPFPEMPSGTLENESCVLSQSGNNFEFKLVDGSATLTMDATMAGEEDPGETPPAPEKSPEVAPMLDVGVEGAAPRGNDAEPHANAWSQPDTRPLEEADERVSTEPKNGGPPNPDPVTLEADHGVAMGTAGRCEGVPSLTFSDDETRHLADKLGHAIIGKFSHTIPTAHQIQKALSHIQFIDGFKWKFVNAKHILIQFRDVRDYGRMLNGPNGAPVWHMEHHPMRVFKWTPDFDTFFESPIAVVWCRVIGLPVHLYDQSALVAIGKLLGKPIQADRATINQSRLTYARLCIEIDISMPPPEEIILNILGKDTRYKVVWERIPLYCAECKHVGHVKEACLKSGKRVEQPRNEPMRRAWRVKKPPHDPHPQRPNRETPAKENTEPGSTKEMGGESVTPRGKAPLETQIQVDEEGFQLVSRRRKGKPTYPSNQAQGGLHKANYLETLLKGSNVATVSFGEGNTGVIDPGGCLTNPS